MSANSSKYEEVNITGHDQDYLKVLKHLDCKAHISLDTARASNEKADANIESSKALLASLGINVEAELAEAAKSSSSKVVKKNIKMRSWEDIRKEAQEAIPGEVSVLDLLTPDELSAATGRVEALREKFDLEHKLDLLDWGIAGLAGAISAIVDILLVCVPSNPGRLGGTAVKGGWLSDKIRNKLKNLYSNDEIAALEDKFKVCFDPPTSKNLAKKVAGLGPRSHRFQSLGHDPILGFIFGVLDIMQGKFTAIDKFGKIIRQDIPGAEQGVGLFEAIAKVFGHLKSDVGTPSGLPAPFMPLFQLLQFGNIDGRTIGELSRAMYANGYDFGHFLAMSIPVMIIEVLVRILYFAKRRTEGHTFMESLPFDLPYKNRQPKLQTMLFTAHTIATAANAGKVWFTGNPMAINLAQWQWYAKVSFSQLRWVLFTKPAEQLAFVQKEIDNDWQKINEDLMKDWEFVDE